MSTTRKRTTTKRTPALCTVAGCEQPRNGPLHMTVTECEAAMGGTGGKCGNPREHHKFVPPPGAPGTIEYWRKRSRANARKAEQRRVAIVATMQRLEELAGRLRETSAGLRDYASGKSSDMNPWHAANRLERTADEIKRDGGNTK